jgi:oligopeptide/dipeptide ABC transporter ATP-binding protein
VSNVDLAVRRGEVVGLVGESGSGKSTVGRLMLGLLAPTAGCVSFDGVDLARADGATLRRLRRRKQLVFQDPHSSLDPRRRVGDQVGDGLAIHGLAPRRERAGRVAALLARVGLTVEHTGRYPHAFSGGQRQRVGIARALSTEPDFIVADEPVSALDVSVQAQVLELLAALEKLGLSVLFISHDLPAARHLCDRAVVLYLGRIMEEGTAAEVFGRPCHPYTQALLSAAPSLDPERRGRRIILTGEPPSPADPPRAACSGPAACMPSQPAPRRCQPLSPAARQAIAWRASGQRCSGFPPSPRR